MTNEELLRAAVRALPGIAVVFDATLSLVAASDTATAVMFDAPWVRRKAMMEELGGQTPWAALWRELARSIREHRETPSKGRQDAPDLKVVSPRSTRASGHAKSDPGPRLQDRSNSELVAELTARPIVSGIHRSAAPLRRGAPAKSPRVSDAKVIGWLVVAATPSSLSQQPVASFSAIAAQHHEPTSVSSVECFHGMWTSDAALRRTFRVVERVAEQPVPVLLRGETGTGKELISQAIHSLSPRRDGPFRAINCAALPANLLESELFGHMRGAFTGAIKNTPGYFQLADGGSLFLDEIGELPLELQAKLLRVVETQSVLPIGARDPVPVDVRIISATHKSLRAEVEAGRFRADLMYRLRVIPVYLPPLRERPQDIVLLAGLFIERLNLSGPRRVTGLAEDAREILLGYDYPGNVRELKNILQYAYVIGETAQIVADDLPPELATPLIEELPLVPTALPSPRGELAQAMDLATSRAQQSAVISRALRRCKGKRSDAAELLGISRITLWRKIRALGIDAG